MTAVQADVVGDQLELDVRPLVIPPRVKGSTIQERFESFHSLNPWVLTALERLTENALAHGRSRLGVKHFVEVLRRQYGRQTTGDEFRLNNDYASRYVRLMIAGHPEWSEHFQLRGLHTE
ncbi:hypothetical protein ASD11_01430 [Aeromicrobium sp. Root495]|uniref:hypothetical protein n=1 Tax=Aeromicrobium sp. Root495 TaxID=1736550 RepID=UPI0006F7C83D|nr:hypothetical protein [Aeromicrobium sp. Root495]KQY58357.1 hypothetical protein ASD11_01430 [Aeromicrobium sp. Root495]